jgi:hypothetical protein
MNVMSGVKKIVAGKTKAMKKVKGTPYLKLEVEKTGTTMLVDGSFTRKSEANAKSVVKAFDHLTNVINNLKFQEIRDMINFN